MSARVYKRKLLYGKRLHVDNKFQNRENEDLFSTNFDSSYLLTTAYESIEQAPSIGCMVGNRGNSEIGSVDFSYDAPPSYNDVAPRDRSQTYEYPRHSGVQNHLRDLTNTSDANQRKKKKITTMMDNNIRV
uniref:uncharacterized protein LOC122602684 n=1 Tax=Erigeron canadensis TaxID=72917 RepID=UPI001CB8EC14|nr:uncharacterized protein LOC122602684 [Erigeron canadensis]